MSRILSVTSAAALAALLAACSTSERTTRPGQADQGRSAPLAKTLQLAPVGSQQRGPDEGSPQGLYGSSGYNPRPYSGSGS